MDTLELRRAIETASSALSARKDEVNRLNVFPVPDGDTGTNMSLTMESVVRELAALPPSASAAEVRKAVTHGSLMGARGNSGVITSQILRGLCEGLEEGAAAGDGQGAAQGQGGADGAGGAADEQNEISATNGGRAASGGGAAGGEDFTSEKLARALERAVEVAFQAVRKPVKGTILTVLEDVAKTARAKADLCAGLEESLEAISAEALASVKRTPEFLPVLKENGVVDSGGFGLVILIQSFVAALLGRTSELPSADEFTAADAEVAIEQVHDWAGSDYMYCTEFLFHSADVDTAAALEFLGGLGDCELLVGSHPDFKVHVHTDTPGDVLSWMTARGQVSEVFIHNMVIESEDRASGLADGAAGPGAGSGSGSGAGGAAGEPKALGFVAVAAGDGMKKILESLGVDVVVSGGQTMNPSTADLLAAVESVNAESVIILPNNSNIVMAAQAAASEAGVPCAVVATKSVPVAFSALFAYDAGATFDENVQAMTDAIEEVSYGEVTTAIKDSKTVSGDPIAPGDVIGIADGELTVVASTVADATLALVGQLAGGGDYDTVTLLAGEDFTDDELDGLAGQIEDAYDDFDVDAQRGDQPLYPIVLSIE